MEDGTPIRPTPVSVASWTPEETSSLCSALRAMDAVFFGHATSVPSNRAKAWLGPLMSEQCVLHVPCDAGPEESSACQRAGISHLPTLIAGGQMAQGVYVPDVLDIVNAPIPVAAGLRGRGAVLYGRDSCVWTRRQRAVLGLPGRGGVEYVDCADGGGGAARCAAAGVAAVPTWELEGVKLPGYRPLAALKVLIEKDKVGLEALRASEAAPRKQ